MAPLLSTPEPLPSVQVQQHGLLEAPRADAEGTVTYSDVIAGGVYRTQGVLPPETVRAEAARHRRPRAARAPAASS